MIDTLPPPRDEFYIGYEERMAPGIARRVRGAIACLGAAAAAGLIVALVAQQPLPPSRFEFGTVRPVAGVLARDPYPHLEVNGRRVWLVGPGKVGADVVIGDTPAGPVIVDGTAIQRGRIRMLEAVRLRPMTAATPAGLRPWPDPARTRVTLTGEIVDSKCFLGVMNPSEGHVHRDCARRCLSGGIPPMLIVRDGREGEQLVLLVSDDGKPIGRQLTRVAGRPVTVTGQLAHHGDQFVLYANLASFSTER
jgi:hypothetical protein